LHARIDYRKVAPDAVQAIAALNRYVTEQSGLDPSLIHLINLRASQINGCAYCVDMHVKEARREGLGEQWINLVCAWRESPVFDDRERAVLAWTEALTDISASGAPDAEFEPLRAHFSDAEITRLTVAIGLINVWNRLAVGLRARHRVDAPVEAV
jgi:AhpD family alkylhydroperoxidase